MKVATSEEVARRIMGRNFWGLREWFQSGLIRSLSFPKMSLSHIENFLWPPEVLLMPCHFGPGKLVKDTHFAFLGIENVDVGTGALGTIRERLTILKWRSILLNPRYRSSLRNPPLFIRDVNWFETHRFADLAVCELRWYLMPIVPPEDDAIPPGYQLALPVEVVTQNILLGIRDHKERCPSPSLARCRGRAQADGRTWEDVVVGVTELNELAITTPNGNGHHNIGLALSREPHF